MVFGDTLKLGYELNELFALAIREGWGPVIQTALHAQFDKEKLHVASRHQMP